MPNNENKIEALENAFPLISGSAFANAREQALSSGQSVLQTHGSMIYEVFPDGSRRPVKPIDPPVHVGQTIFNIE
jgi:hypothetical protein